MKLTIASNDNEERNTNQGAKIRQRIVEATIIASNNGR